ncbi:hypothetical protein [Ochrobactrum sp. AN78]|jgi:hypothetical protein|nr:MULTISPECIES: hypothetical protein [Brucella/Ochrobactrum group]MCV9907010.1 hypothetical protein [Brucella sp. HL-2]MDH7793003.1 hypothetical protein [Ochrobactrum sp. AN78]
MKPDTVVSAVLAMCLLLLTWIITQSASDEMASLQQGTSGQNVPAALIVY